MSLFGYMYIHTVYIRFCTFKSCISKVEYVQEFTPPDLHKEWSSLVSSENCPWVASELVTALPRIFNMGKAEREATI